jgi:hypothetical protein
MPINVMYQNGETGSVEEYRLYELIAQNKIKKFGWCTIDLAGNEEIELSKAIENS